MDEPLPVATVPLSSSANGGVALSVAVVAPPEMNRGDASAQNATQSSGNQGRSLTAHSWAKPRIVPANDQQTAAQETPADDAEPKAKKRHSRIAMRMAFTMGSSSDSDPSDVAQRLPTFKERFAAFSAMTTAHGFASAMDTRYPRVCRFVIWMLFTVAGESKSGNSKAFRRHLYLVPTIPLVCLFVDVQASLSSHGRARSSTAMSASTRLT